MGENIQSRDERQQRAQRIEQQEMQYFLERIAAMMGVMISVFCLMDLLGIFHDQNTPLFIMVLGAAMNIVLCWRSLKRKGRLRAAVFMAAAVILLVAVLYMIFF